MENTSSWPLNKGPKLTLEVQLGLMQFVSVAVIHSFCGMFASSTCHGFLGVMDSTYFHGCGQNSVQ